MSRRRPAFIVLCAILAAACEAREPKELGRGGGPPPPTIRVESTASEVTVSTVMRDNALSSDQPIIELAVANRHAAIVSLPMGATEKRPVLVAAHGRDDTPNGLCDMWRGIVGNRAFVVCPTGIPSTVLPGTFTYDTPRALGDEIDAALAALRQRYPDHVDEGPLVYAGFSLGSFQGVRFVNRDPEHTPRVILIEGGHDPWDQPTIASFADGGGQRVLFVTGQAINEQRALRIASELTEAGISAKVVHAEDAGHVYTGPVRERIAESFEWVIEGDDRWKI